MKTCCPVCGHISLPEPTPAEVDAGVLAMMETIMRGINEDGLAIDLRREAMRDALVAAAKVRREAVV